MDHPILSASVVVRGRAWAFRYRRCGLSVCLVVIFVWLTASGAAAQEFQPPWSGFSDPVDAFPWGSALEGLKVVVSQGHGWEGGPGGSYQRTMYKWTDCGTCEGIVEDIYNAEVCSDHLVPLLRQAGAKVYTVRQIDRQPASVGADDGDTGYFESGAWAAGTNPDLGWGGDYRSHNARNGGHATWTLNIPAEGDYWVHVRWAAGTNRCDNVRYSVEHAGGIAEFRVNQQQDGSMWVSLGRLHFAAGPASIVVDAPEAWGVSGCYIIADAVSAGGGSGSESGRPWWQVSASEWLAYSGPAALSAFNEVTIRPALANSIGADAFVSYHADASSTVSTTGSSTYRYNCGTGVQWATLDPATCDLPVGSADIQAAIQDRIISDLRAGWDPAWVNRGRMVADFGELRELTGIPGVLVESGFFTNVTTSSGMLYPDNRSLHDPRFRRIVARAILRGLIDAVAPGTPMPPDTPAGLYVVGGAGSLTAYWKPVFGASGYRVYVAVDGRGFDTGTVTTLTSFDLEGIPVGSVAVVRVSALNAGGESPTSGAVAGSARADGAPADILLVDGFDRLDAWVREDFNHHDYSVEHGLALAAAGFGFDGASDEASIAAGSGLGGYAVVDWIAGRESFEHETFSAAAQSAARDFVDGGGCLVASGTEIGWDLGYLGTAADSAFLADVFGAAYASDNAGTRIVRTDPEGALVDLADMTIDDGSHGIYDARYPDTFTTVQGGVPALLYASGSIAAVSKTGSAGRAVLAGFPLEAVYPLTSRTALVESIVAFCRAGNPGTDDAVSDEGQGAGDELTVADEQSADESGTEGDGADAGDVFESDSAVEPSDGDLSGVTDAAFSDGVFDVPADSDGRPDSAYMDSGSDHGIAVDVARDRGVHTDPASDGQWNLDANAFGRDDASNGNAGTGGCSSTAAESRPAGLFLLMAVLLLGLCLRRRSGQPGR